MFIMVMTVAVFVVFIMLMFGFMLMAVRKKKMLYELVLITFFTCGDGHDDGCA